VFARLYGFFPEHNFSDTDDIEALTEIYIENDWSFADLPAAAAA